MQCVGFSAGLTPSPLLDIGLFRDHLLCMVFSFSHWIPFSKAKIKFLVIPLHTVHLITAYIHHLRCFYFCFQIRADVFFCSRGGGLDRLEMKSLPAELFRWLYRPLISILSIPRCVDNFPWVLWGSNLYAVIIPPVTMFRWFQWHWYQCCSIPIVRWCSNGFQCLYSQCCSSDTCLVFSGIL